MDCIKRVKTRVKNGGHNVREEDIIRRYYRSVLNFWSDYRNLADEWILFYNGFEYAPLIVSYGKLDKYDIINMEMQNKFNEILKISEGLK